jgi:hypothetical protein
MDFPWSATASAAPQLVFGALENPSNGADGDRKILCKSPLGDGLALRDALSSRFEREMQTLPKERLRNWVRNCTIAIMGGNCSLDPRDDLR